MGKSTTGHKGVYIASKSSIRIEFCYPDPQTRQREYLKGEPTNANLELAYQFLAQVKAAIRDGSFDYAATFPNSKKARNFTNNRLLATYMRRWLDAHKARLKASTFATHRRFVEHQLGPLGRMRMDEVVWPDIRDWCRKQNVGQKTLNNKLSILRGAFQEAFDDGEIRHNPLSGRKTPKQRSVVVKQDPIDPFTAEEIQAIIAAATGRERAFIQFGFATGMRISEIIGLDWRKVDFIGGHVRVDQVMTTASKELEEPKTQKSIRGVKLNSLAQTAILFMKEFSYLKGEEVFQNPRTDKRWYGDVQIRDRMWRRILKKAGVRYRYPYQMRHTYASMALLAGESPYFVANQLGHTDPSFTMRVYQRYIPNTTPNAGNLVMDVMMLDGTEKRPESVQTEPNPSELGRIPSKLKLLSR